MNNSECVARSSVVVLAVKPHLYAEALADLAAHCPDSSDPLEVSGGRLWISIMAGVTLADLRTAISAVDPECRVVRTMPNTTMKVCGVRFVMLLLKAGVYVKEGNVKRL